MAYGKNGRGGDSAPRGKFNLENYIEVKDRIGEFFGEFPNGFIQTFIYSQDGPEIVIEARILRTIEELTAGAYTSGFAREVEGKSIS